MTDVEPPRPKNALMRREVALTPREEKLFDFLVQAVAHFKTGTTLRVAGGWVRDKLLGSQCDDIDIALDNVLGRQFAEMLNKYFEHLGEPTQSFGVIQPNAEQSKHLETATMKLFDGWVDFVNLRTEEYSQDSRIPSMEIGTPSQDALRRDLTINALFYNITDRKVEDFTGKGLDDLEAGIARTPLPPLTTFLDDPLRVLRTIRFASRLHFAIEPAVLDAARDPKVQSALRHKISRERIGKELKGMFSSGDSAVQAFEHVVELGLYDCVFDLPADLEINETDFRQRSVRIMKNMNSYVQQRGGLAGPVREHHQLPSLPHGWTAPSGDEMRWLLMASFLQPLHAYALRNAKKRPVPLLQHVVLDSIKWPTKDADSIQLIVDYSRRAAALLASRKRLPGHDDPAFRRDAGLLIRGAGSLWQVAVMAALGHALPIEGYHGTAEAFDVVRQHELLVVNAHSVGLDGCWHLKHLINGSEVSALFKRPPGPWLAAVLERQMAWQLEHPHKSADECRSRLESSVLAALLPTRAEQTPSPRRDTPQPTRPRLRTTAASGARVARRRRRLLRHTARHRARSRAAARRPDLDAR
eukprot:TRINITY_DN9856_c0_g1_i2.p1 TRINITY_DN9856_c0_g1~~TRINITY_DN9856_c0_g1_i2.p1  ORF type:complete len:652 (+),score=163.58 TRINITY_DN9856_c0_g1_i2:205-1956(+)